MVSIPSRPGSRPSTVHPEASKAAPQPAHRGSGRPKTTRASAAETGRRAVPGAARASEYDAAFRRTSGWTGADGTYSLPLRAGRTLWLFSDTLLGEVDAKGHRTLWPHEPPHKTPMLRNSVGIQRGRDPSTITFPLSDRTGAVRDQFAPPDGRGWFWVHDGIENGDGTATVLLNQFEESKDPRFLFGKQIGLWAATVRLDGERLEVEGYARIGAAPAATHEREDVWGASILDDGPWTYVYGAHDSGSGTKQMMVARCPRGSVGDESKWTFFEGRAWVGEAERAAPLGPSGNECSVDKLPDGRYLHVSISDMNGPVLARSAPTPTGPWSEPKTLWTPPESKGSVYSYNAKAHPELSDERGLLISYNVNSMSTDQTSVDADVYRPRFVRIPWKELP